MQPVRRDHQVGGQPLVTRGDGARGRVHRSGLDAQAERARGQRARQQSDQRGTVHHHGGFAEAGLGGRRVGPGDPPPVRRGDAGLALQRGECPHVFPDS
jgi:hypothetical protein